jgi:6-phosphogluconolactonase
MHRSATTGRAAVSVAQGWLVRDDPVAAAAEDLHRALLAALAETPQGRITFVVSGGRTPEALMPRLLGSGLDWDRIDLFASDERLVSPDHPDSTEGMFRRLFAQANQPLHYHGPGDAHGALATWKAAWARLARPAAAFLGLGPDGHTASLFPGRPEAGDADLIMAAVPETAPHAHARLTLGVGALTQARRIVLVAQGAEKRRVLSAALSADADPRQLPVAWIARLDQTRIFSDGSNTVPALS